MAKAHEVPFWKICEELKISEPTLTRKLRKELTEEEKGPIKKIIQRLAVV